MGRARGQQALFVTERAVFEVGAKGLELIEIAPGLDAERDVIAQMGFRPQVSPGLRTMDRRLFEAGLMGLDRDVLGKPPRYRSARLAEWYESRR
jgi:propionate CoA-transferase